MAIQERRVKKVYFVLLKGILQAPQWVNGPLARDMDTPVYVKQTVRKSHSAVSAKTYFEPIKVGNGFTLAKVLPITGRKHQIRAHAEFLGLPVVGDKIYGGRPELFLTFAEKGWTSIHADYLDMRRQALQAHALTFYEGVIDESPILYHFEIPLAWDMAEFCQHRMELVV
jgi:23S rRNA pseudouridine1911/1915/1917 synthase